MQDIEVNNIEGLIPSKEKMYCPGTSIVTKLFNSKGQILKDPSDFSAVNFFKNANLLEISSKNKHFFTIVWH